jgi:alpha-L-rhamnosidase
MNKLLTNKIIIIIISASLWLSCTGNFHPNISIYDLRCEYLSKPLGIDLENPRFFWKLDSSRRNVTQSAYRLLVASDPELLMEEKPDIWNSGKVKSNLQAGITYQGKSLNSNQTYFWKVRVYDQNDKPSPWSEITKFHTGILSPDEWKAKWIGDRDTSNTSPLLRKSFNIEKRVRNAHIFISGIGYYELYLNGKKVGDHKLDPATTNYKKRVLYSTYDVRDFLKSGENVVGVMLGKGWYKHRGIQQYGDRPKLFMQLSIDYEDGSSLTIVSDESWSMLRGPIISNSIWDGEVYDAREEKEDWNKCGYDDSKWEKAVRVEPPESILDSQLLPPIRVVSRKKPVSIFEPEDGIYVFDFGQNLTGWSSLRVKGERGTKITLKTAEATRKDMARMRCEDTTEVSMLIDPSPNRSAKAVDIYILKGRGKIEIYEPRFTFHGFRYVQIEGFPGEPTRNNLEVCVVHTDVDSTGHFSCSNPLFNQIHHNIIWGQLSNLFGKPTDCPQRDERLGWTGDAHLTAEEAMYNFDMAAFYTKWLQDFKDVQSDSGYVTDVVPPHWLWKGTPAWQVAYPLIVWYMYKYYGDMRIIEEHYSNLKMWVNYLGSTADDYIVEWGRGDWVAPKTAYVPEDKSIPITSTGYYYKGAEILAKIARALGKTEDEEYYSKLTSKISDSFNRHFLNSDKNQYGTGSQTSNAFPLYLGIVPEENQKKVLENLILNIKDEHNGHLSTGILGTKALVEALPKYGREDVLYEIANKTTFPSWGYMISKGATTLWERWGGFRYFNADMNSLNHIMFGCIDEFFYRDLAGIRPETPGYKNIVIKPHVLNNLTWVKGSVNTIRGKISSEWKRDKNSFTLKVTIPVNSIAEIYMPKMGNSKVIIREGRHTIWKDGKPVDEAPGILSSRGNQDYIIFETGSGNYNFHLEGI